MTANRYDNHSVKELLFSKMALTFPSFANVSTLVSDIDEDAIIRPYILYPGNHSILSVKNWFHISLGNRNVVGFYFPKTELAEHKRSKKFSFVLVHNDQTMGLVTTETIVDLFAVIFKRISIDLFNLIVTTFLEIIIRSNDGSPIRDEQIDEKFASTASSFVRDPQDPAKFISAIKYIANGSRFRYQKI